MIESPLEYSFEDLFVGQKANFLKKIDEGLVNNFAKISGNLSFSKELHQIIKHQYFTLFSQILCV